MRTEYLGKTGVKRQSLEHLIFNLKPAGPNIHNKIVKVRDVIRTPGTL
jgi:hypothetical protein